jgi:hypothetical protein
MSSHIGFLTPSCMMKIACLSMFIYTMGYQHFLFIFFSANSLFLLSSSLSLSGECNVSLAYYKLHGVKHENNTRPHIAHVAFNAQHPNQVFVRKVYASCMSIFNSKKK